MAGGIGAGAAVLCVFLAIFAGTVLVVIPSLISTYTNRDTAEPYGSGNSLKIGLHLIIL